MTRTEPSDVSPFGPSKNLELVTTFLRQIFRDVERGWLVLNYDLDGKFRSEWFEPHQLDEMAARAVEVQPDSGVWYSIATRKQRLARRRGTADDVLDVVAFFADVDYLEGGPHTKAGLPPTRADALALIAAFPLVPTVVVDSGHGFQAGYSLAEPMPAAEAEPVLRRFAATWFELARQRGWTLDNVFTTEHVFRLPGTLNTKNPADAKAVTIVDADWSLRYGLDDIDERTIEPELPKRPPRVVMQTSGKVLGELSPGDWFNERTPMADVLSEARCAYSHTSRSDGRSHWFAPHRAETREQIGATVYDDPDGEHVVIWSETWAAELRVEPRASLDAFGLMARIRHGGGFNAAAKAVSDERARVTGSGAVTPPAASGDSGDADASDGEADGLSIELIDWSTIDERGDEIVEGLLIPGRWTEIVAAAKAGKSTLMMGVTIAVSEGRDPFDGTACEPVIVLYVDGEMGRFDVLERVTELGHDPANLTRWHATDLSPQLDTLVGGNALVAAVQELGVGVVVIDGLNGVVGGPEKEDTTWRALFDYTIAPLKRLGVAIITGDNEGKESAKGPRGSSVKLDKGDAVIVLTRTDNGVKLATTHRRTSAYPKEWHLSMGGLDGEEPITFRRTDTTWPQGTKDAVDILDELAIPLVWGRPKITAALAAAAATAADPTRFKVRTTVLTAAIRYRKNRVGHIVNGSAGTP